MRRAVTLALVAVVAACGPKRAPAPAPVAVADADAERAAVARGDREPPLPCLAHPTVDAWEARLRGDQRHRADTAHRLARGKRYLPAVRAIVAAEGLPPGIALLPALESGFRPRVRGPRGSVGLWQLQAATARHLGLVVNRRRDDRLDPARATRAAVRYLDLLHRRYGDWALALAAYNAGPARVDRALRRRPGATYWELVETRSLPPVSRDYVPRFVAILRVVEPMPVCS
jgi:hypothetical protein